MALLDDILQWTETDLAPWQRDAARRLFQKETGLSAQDYDELYALLKAAEGLPNPTGLVAVPLAKEHLPAATTHGAPVILKMLRDLKNVNRIASGQKLPFSPAGLTIVYGGNGSGKSGYARVMKRACRARDQSESVLADANDPLGSTKVPEAIFDIEIAGASQSLHWKRDGTSPEQLATVAVFDCHCARAYLNSEQEVAYLPYGLDVVESLANKVLLELQRRLEIEIAAVDVACEPYAHLIGETEVGRLIQTLSAKTDVEKVRNLGTLSTEETQDLADLNRALAEADPRQKAKELRLSGKRLKDFTASLQNALSWVTDHAIARLKQLDDAVVVAAEAEKTAAAYFRAGEDLLPGTGELVWKNLFEAARRFSIEVAYPEHVFPHVTKVAVCPLCQQRLEDGGPRLQRFADFVKQDAAKAVAETRQQLNTSKSKIERANLDIGLNETLKAEIGELAQGLPGRIQTFYDALVNRRNWMVAILETRAWNTLPVLPVNPRRDVRDLAARQLRAARTMGRAADETKAAELKKRRNELQARQNLSVRVNAIVALIDRMKHREALESCRKDLRTKPISDQSKEFASNAVTAALKRALDAEFKALGIGYIKTVLKDRNDKGKTKLRLVLNLPATAKIEDILSEGEQRAIAVGSFLAELQLANHSGCIVFDDPVSSLDHKRRGKVAKRLAAESLRRQVLVFTHDVVFLHQLRHECDNLKATQSICFLEADGGYYGNVSQGLPWAHKSFGERIDRLEKTQKRFEKMPWPADPSEDLAGEMIRQYSFLRATIERVVQDLALNATVQRFRDYIEVKRLEQVVGLEQAEVEEIFRLNQRCNDVIEAHDPASAKDEPPPTPDELKQDIEDLKKLIEAIQTRMKRTKAATP